jgi:hypothetical protein
MSTEQPQQETLATVPGAELPDAAALAGKSPSFAALMGSFRAGHDSEVQAAAALCISPTALSDYCDAKSLPTAPGLRRLAPLLEITLDDLTALVEAQRAAQARGEVIATVAPVRTRIRRLPITTTSAPATAGEGA